MEAFFQLAKPISNDQVITQLRQLRQRSYCVQSDYAVSALLEIKLAADQYLYVSGVNAENLTHNRLSLHAEQNAVVAANCLLNGNVSFSRLWVIGAPRSVSMDSTHILADAFAMPCGHCRQILNAFAAPEAQIHAVSLNGAISKPYTLPELLPDAFSGQNLNVNASALFSSNLNEQVWKLAQNNLPLTGPEIYSILQNLTPRIINSAYLTSATVACIIKLNYLRYVPGVLVQDIAFLTTDAFLAAWGNAVTQFGEDIYFEEIHLFATSRQDLGLSGFEIDLIRQFARQDIPIYFYLATGEVSELRLSACINAQCTV